MCLRPRLAALLFIPILAVGCTKVWHTVEAEELQAPFESDRVSTPVRAYLADGSIVVLPDGARASEGMLRGNGFRYTLTLENRQPFVGVTLDSVVAMETFQEGRERQGESLLLALLSTAATIAVTPFILVAIFGSCPTIYVEVDGAPQLQAEPFSYSIAPLFEARDVDRLYLPDDDAGLVRLEVRNEALETHYINHMELLAAHHRPDEVVLSDPTGQPLALSEIRAPLSAVDRDGRQVLPEILHQDSLAFRSSSVRLAAATSTDFTDFLELEVPVVPGASEVALVLRLRNTLLNTVLFYDLMLAEAGFSALDWLGSDLSRIGTAVELGAWYRARMGIRVEMEGEEGFEEVGYVPDAGPIAWTERAVAIPVPGGSERARVRLHFVSDSWSIDRVAVAGTVKEVQVQRVPVARVLRPDGRLDPDAVGELLAPDDVYLVTYPGDRIYLEFDVPPAPENSARSHLLVSQGYYVEWIRGHWLRGAVAGVPFRPEDGVILEAMRRWGEVKEGFERDFHDHRIPVR